MNYLYGGLIVKILIVKMQGRGVHKKRIPLPANAVKDGYAGG